MEFCRLLSSLMAITKAALVNLTLSDGSYLVAGKHVAAFTDEEEAAV